MREGRFFFAKKIISQIVCKCNSLLNTLSMTEHNLRNGRRTSPSCRTATINLTIQLDVLFYRDEGFSRTISTVAGRRCLILAAASLQTFEAPGSARVSMESPWSVWPVRLDEQGKRALVLLGGPLCGGAAVMDRHPVEDRTWWTRLGTASRDHALETGSL